MERLSGDFNRGYTKALLDVRNFIDGHSIAMQSCKLNNRKGVLKILNALLDHREELRETGDCHLVYDINTREFK